MYKERKREREIEREEDRKRDSETIKDKEMNMLRGVRI